jgi:hypothetical protein
MIMYLSTVHAPNVKGYESSSLENLLNAGQDGHIRARASGSNSLFIKANANSQLVPPISGTCPRVHTAHDDEG